MGRSGTPFNTRFLGSTPVHTQSQRASRSVPPFLQGRRSGTVQSYSPGGANVPQCNTCFLGPTRVHNLNGISIGSAIFAKLTAESLGLYLKTGRPFPPYTKCSEVRGVTGQKVKLGLPENRKRRRMTQDTARRCNTPQTHEKNVKGTA